MNDTTTELRQLARQVRDYQTERGWSDSQLLREIPQLGSTKTYKRILDPEDPLDELKSDNQLRNCQHAVSFIQTLRKQNRVKEDEYDDFDNVLHSRSAVTRALAETDTVARFVAVVGENGTGKSTAAKHIALQHGNIVLPAEALDGWKDSRGAPLWSFTRTFNRIRAGDIKTHPYPIQQLELLIEGIGGQRLVLMIDEAHYLGPRALNDLKSIINRCPSLVIVCFFIPALLRKLVTHAYEETRQLFGNRMCERVNLPSPQPGAIIDFLGRRGVTFDAADSAKRFSENLALEAPELGNWRFIVNFAREAKTTFKGKPLLRDDFVIARDNVKRRLGRKIVEEEIKRVSSQGRAS